MQQPVFSEPDSDVEFFDSEYLLETCLKGHLCYSAPCPCEKSDLQKETYGPSFLVKHSQTCFCPGWDHRDSLLKLLKLRWSFSWKQVGKGLKKQSGHSGNLWKGAVVGGGGLFSQHSWKRMCDQASGSAKEKK